MPNLVMKKFGLLFLPLLLFFGLFGICPEQSLADTEQNGTPPLQKKRNELKQMEIRKKEIQLHLEESYSAEQDVLKRIKELSKDIETLQQQIVQTTQQQKHTDHILSRQSKEVEHLKRQIEKHAQSIRKRVRSIYRFLKGKQALSLTDFQQRLSFKNVRLMERVLHHEVLLLQDFYKKRQSLEKLLGPYHQRQDIQEKLYQESSKIKLLLEQKQQEHHRLLVSIQQDREVYFRYLDELQQSMEKVAAELDNLENQQMLANQYKNSRGLLAWKGKLPSPVEGRLIRPFQKKNRRSNPSRYHGITVETAEDSFISSIALGKVVFANPLEGYQKLVIVDHGNNSFSVYGKLEKLNVSVGDFVDMGTTIGKVSQEPITSKFHAYFEIRHKGKSVDPMSWFKSGVYRK